MARDEICGYRGPRQQEQQATGARFCAKRLASALTAAEEWRAWSRLRYQFVKPTLLADTAWEMFVELFISSTTSAWIAQADLIEQMRVPLSTASRWVTALKYSDLVVLEEDGLPPERKLVRLSDNGLSVAVGFFNSIARVDKSDLAMATSPLDLVEEVTDV